MGENKKTHHLSVSRSYSGPIPDPETLMKFAQIDPTLVNRIVTMAENQTAHRIKIESIVIPSREKQSWWGIWIAGILALLLVVAGVIAMFLNKDNIAWTIFGFTIVSIVYVFITGKIWQSKPPKNKNLNDDKKVTSKN